MNKFSLGQPVTSAMYDGVWIVGCIGEWKGHSETFYTYTIRCKDEYRSGQAEEWLEAVRIKNPVVKVVTDNHYMKIKEKIKRYC